MIFHSLQRQARIFTTKRILVSKPAKGVSTSDIWITAAFTSLSGSMIYLNNQANSKIDATEGRLNDKIEATEGRLNGRLDSIENKLEQLIESNRRKWF